MSASVEPMSPLDPRALEIFKQEQEAKKTGRGKSREVCVCGHSINHHSQTSAGLSVCNPGNTACRCSTARGVLVAENLRLFMFGTTGSGTDHALSKGMLACFGASAGFEWIEKPDVLCDKCQEPTAMPIPVALLELTSEDGKPMYSISDTTQKMNKILCRECVTKIPSYA